MLTILKCNLQLFADGGAEGIAGSAAGFSAESGQVAADNGVNATNDSNADAEANYKSFINSPEYKDIHKRAMDKTFQRRFREKDRQITDLQGRIDSYAPLLDRLAIKYNVTDPTNVDAIIKAAEQDNSYLEEYAMRHGVDTATAEQLIKAERITAENDRRIAQEKEQEAFRQQFDVWMRQAEECQQYYPDFDFNEETNSPETGEQFGRLINSGVPVKTAYEVVHHTEMVGGAMQYAYNSARQDMADARTARAQRPRENGTFSQQASAVTTDVSRLTLKQIRNIQAAVNRGEKVTPENMGNYM